ncbi:MAG: DNRLRE domain-containing protein, partial [Caldilineaceae bacterium]|nr:DNRLRE domain-containing protein [Caldilineaceae bacterium]
ELSLNWNNKPGVTWGGPVTTVAAVGDVGWPAKPLVSAWHEGTMPNYGLVLRGTSGNGAGVRADSKEWGVAPKLVITYSTPAQEGPRPDLGDAPDSTNHHSQNNTAYPGSGTLGQFPTVWEVPAGQAAGPRHRNATLEGWLGDYISPETEADQGPDLDGANNILRGAGGAVGDVADKDRGDDGWRNRTVKFFDCQRATLDIRVSKDVAATRNFMYLNVWFDGNRDGDWQDLSQCQASDDEPAQAGYEWIVQNYIIDMTAVPAGGSYDFAVNTQKVFNGTPNAPHWMRFMLSEEPATQPAEGGLPDGRGPHPTSTQQFYQFGETEDVIQKPPPAGEDGQLVLEKRVITPTSPVPYAGTVTYEIRLRNNGGSQPIQAQLRDLLDYPQHVLPHVENGTV